MGLDEPPHAGDMFEVVDDVKAGRISPPDAASDADELAVVKPVPFTLEDIFSRFQAGETKELLLIIKVDVDGSLEPVVKSIENLEVGGLKVKVLHADVGEITENDVNLAAASDAVIIGFNVDARLGGGAHGRVAGRGHPHL